MQLILIVDDSVTARKIVRIALESYGYAVAEAGDGQSALASLDTVVPALVLSDVNMGPMDGLALLTNIRRRFTAQQLPVLMLTTEASDELKARGRVAGATGWLVKPFDAKRMSSVIAHVLSARPSESGVAR